MAQIDSRRLAHTQTEEYEQTDSETKTQRTRETKKVTDRRESKHTPRKTTKQTKHEAKRKLSPLSSCIRRFHPGATEFVGSLASAAWNVLSAALPDAAEAPSPGPRGPPSKWR